MQHRGMVTGRHLAIDSTFIKAWSDRKSTDKKSPEFKIAKNCNFARVGKVKGSYDVGYRVHAATVTKSKVPVALLIVPGNMHDRRAFKDILELALKQVPNPLAVSADKGYSSTKNRNLIKQAGAACFIRPTKTDLKGNPLEFFIPGELSEGTYWFVYWKRNAVELTFAFAKGQCGLDRPRVVNEKMIKQHVYLSFIIQLFYIFASTERGMKNNSFSFFF